MINGVSHREIQAENCGCFLSERRKVEPNQNPQVWGRHLQLPVDKGMGAGFLSRRRAGPFHGLFAYGMSGCLMEEAMRLLRPGSRPTFITIPKSFKVYEITNRLGSNACPWMKIIPRILLQNECENGPESMDRRPAESDRYGIVPDKTECASHSSPGGNMY